VSKSVVAISNAFSQRGTAFGTADNERATARAFTSLIQCEGTDTVEVTRILPSAMTTVVGLPFSIRAFSTVNPSKKKTLVCIPIIIISLIHPL
jgi:hypothetical protein